MSENLNYRVNSVQKLQIEEICRRITRYEEPKDFITEALGTFITWWTDPTKVDKIMEDMAKDFTPEMIAQMKKTAPDYTNNLERTVGKLGSRQQSIIVSNDGSSSQIPAAQIQSQIPQLGPRTDFFNEFITSLNDAKEKIESMTFPTPQDYLPYDEYPLIWNFYSRFLPIKIVISVLAHMIFEKNNSKISYKEFQERAYDVAVIFAEKLRNYENVHAVPRNKKISTGFPVPSYTTNIPANKLTETMAKIESSKKRFLEHFTGMTEESWRRRDVRKPNLAYFDGALNAMGLVYVTDEDKELKITLSKRGADFFVLQNPVMDNGSFEISISDEEKDFILTNIIPSFELENSTVKKIMLLIGKASKESDPIKRRIEPTQLNQTVREAATEFVVKYPDEAKLQGIVKVEYLAKLTKKSTKEIEETSDKEFEKLLDGLGEKALDDKDIISWRVATMGRLAEIVAVNWVIDKHGNSYFTIPN